MTRVGLYGGSFNPIHLGHLRTAVEVRTAAQLDEVWLMPAHHPPHKDADEIAPASDRLAMVEASIVNAAGLRAEPIELERSGPSYSIDTLRLLKERHPTTKFSLILGFDAFRELHTWHEYRRLVNECDFIVTTRPPQTVTQGENPELFAELPIAVTDGFCYDSSVVCYVNESGHRLEFVPVTQLEISASQLRADVARGSSIRFLVPGTVEDYILERGLYASGQTENPIQKP